MSTHRENFLRKHGLPLSTSLSIKQISDLSKIPVSVLQQVYNRGIGAWKSSSAGQIRMKGTFQKGGSAPKSARLSKEQWAMARIYSFVDKGKTFQTADSDLAKLV